jgi:AcrR family transcriptional regulator
MPKADAQSRSGSGSGPAADPGGRSEDRGAATRARILEAASDLIAEGGWSAATTRALAERAGVNPALVHYHFGSIAAVLEAAVAQMTQSALAEPMAALLEAPTLREGIRDSLAALRRVDERSMRVLTEVLVRAGHDDVIGAWFRAEFREYRKLIAGRVAAAQAAAELPADLDADGTAAVLAAIGDGLALHVLIDPDLRLEPAIAALDRLLDPRPANRAVAPDRSEERT